MYHRNKYKKPSCRSVPNTIGNMLAIESGIDLRKNLPKLDPACFPLFTLIKRNEG